MPSLRITLGPWLCRGVIGVACVLLAMPCAGRESAADQSVEELVDEGIRLRRAGDDLRALERFQRAEKLDPESPRVLVHLAANHQALGEWAAADEYLARALANPKDAYVVRHQATLAAARRAIDAHMGTLQVTGGPEGAELRLNGRRMGTLPLERPIRIDAGIYTLEVTHPGHFPVTRSVALAGGVLVRESVDLSPRELERPVSFAPEEQESVRSSSAAPWLTWAFLGLGTAATAGAVYAWSERERHVEVWNDESRCVAVGFTREELCGARRRDGERAESWMWIGAASAGALLTAGVVTYVLRPSRTESTPTALSCGVGLASVGCSGHF